MRAASGASHRPGLNTPRRGRRRRCRVGASGAARGCAHVTGAFACGPKAARARPGGLGEADAGGGGRRAGGAAGRGVRAGGAVAGYFPFSPAGVGGRGAGRRSRSRGCAPTLSAQAEVFKFFGARAAACGPAGSPPSLCSSPALRCAALAPHVLFGWVSNGGRGGSAAGRRLQGGANLGPRATAWGKYGRYLPSSDVSRPLLPNWC